MTEIVWLDEALQDLENIAQYIAAENRAAAARIVGRIVSTASSLRDYPKLGRLLNDGDTYRLTITHTPYLVFYRLRDRVEILAVFHAARKWPEHLA